jgi:hypothetical protein
MLSLAEDYLAERRRLGFEPIISGARLKAVARIVDESGHTGPLTTGVVLSARLPHSGDGAADSAQRNLNITTKLASDGNWLESDPTIYSIRSLVSAAARFARLRTLSVFEQRFLSGILYNPDDNPDKTHGKSFIWIV